MSDALGTAVESPERSEDLQRMARPEGERPIRWGGGCTGLYRCVRLLFGGLGLYRVPF
jgi:hypothetical protein